MKKRVAAARRTLVPSAPGALPGIADGIGHSVSRIPAHCLMAKLLQRAAARARSEELAQASTANAPCAGSVSPVSFT